MIGVYAIVHRASGRRYVGSSIKIAQRWAEHEAMCRYRKHHCRYLQNAWAKYGSTAFDFVVLEECSQGELIAREQVWIDFYRAYEPENGFNTSAKAGPAVGGGRWLEAVREAQAKRRGEKRPEVGKKIAATLKGRPLSEERKAKIAAAHLGKKRGPHSEIHRQRIAAKSRLHKHSPETLAKIKANHWSKSPEKLAAVVAKTLATKLVAKQLQHIKTEAMS